MPDALDRKLAELEHRLLAGHEQIGRGVGVPFLLLLHPPSEELRVCRDVNSLVAKLRAEGLQVEVIDCNQVLLDYLHRAEELQRAIRAEKRNPSALKEFGIGEVLAEALVERVITAQQQMSGPGVVVLTRVGALHPFLLPNIVQERLAGRRVHVPIVFLGPAEDDSGSDYLFLGVGTPLPGHVSLGRLDLGDTAMQIGQLFLADIGRDINPVIKVADYTEAELQNELEDYVVTEVVEKYLLDFLEHYTDTRQKQTDRVGVWISGYVGSGKSHFAKLLGLLTTNPRLGRLLCRALGWQEPGA